ncbi:MAG: xanthine dehydrogenase family protein subunit M [Pyrinomonadaceae bacterium]|nr:xanthine dehydrogenase family protein subunit M [Pyrinomonadaceae bacterium]
MRPFKYTRAAETAKAVEAISKNKNARFLAGGTNIIDLMKEDVARPDELVDINRLSFDQIKATSGGISLGALAKNTETANHPLVRQNLPLLSQAILAGASGQIRNMATNGGNLNQRTRCTYFYDTAMPCNKREPGTGCGAMEGINRMHAVFGWSEKCVAVHPSDMCVALAALDANVKVQGADGKTRSIAFADYHRLPGDSPELDNNLKHDDLITEIEIPKNNFAANSYYLKVRDRASYAFALVSVAAALDVSGGKIKDARIALGGVAHKPWRALEAEKFLKGKDATEANFKAAAEMEMKAAKPLEHNKFKVELGKRAVARALTMAMNGGKTA